VEKCIREGFSGLVKIPPRFYCPNCKEGNLSENGLHPVDNGEIERVLNKTNNDMMEELWV